MKVLFLDESGDHNLSVIDPSYPIFVLGGVIVDKDYADGQLTEAFDDFKSAMFGRTDIVLHTADIVRTRNGFEGLKNTEFSALFYAELNSLMRQLQYSVVACIIHKDEHYRHYEAYGLDPYHLGLNVLVDLFCSAVGRSRNNGLIVAEERDKTLDSDLLRAWSILRTKGTPYTKPRVVRNTIQTLDLRGKKENLAGLQLADLVVSPIGRHILGKEDKEDWRIVEQKLRHGPNGEIEGYGLISFPK